MDVAVIGLGRVGLPLALAFADRGLSVVGVDVDAARLDAVVHAAAANPGRPVEQFDAVNRAGSAAVAAAASTNSRSPATRRW